MSRAALNRQLQVRARTGTLALSLDPFLVLDGVEPQEECGADGALGLPLHGNARTLNLEMSLATNIVSSAYFKFELLELCTLDEWLAEAARAVTHVLPWEPGMSARTPSGPAPRGPAMAAPSSEPPCRRCATV